MGFDPVKYLDFKLVMLRQIDRINDTTKSMYGENTRLAIKNLANQVDCLESLVTPYMNNYSKYEGEIKALNEGIDHDLIEIEEKYDERKFLEAVLKKYSYLVKRLGRLGILPAIHEQHDIGPTEWPEDKEGE